MNELKEWIRKQRLSNYGYDWKTFRKMSAYKSRVFKRLDSMPDREVRKSLAQAGILGRGGRLSRTRTRSGKKEWQYATGQSFNEELLNIATIGASKGKKSFWEVQDKWYG